MVRQSSYDAPSTPCEEPSVSCELSETATPEDFARPRWVAQPDVRERAQRLSTKFEEVYARPPAGVWAAPGRANLMGEYIDY